MVARKNWLPSLVSTSPQASSPWNKRLNNDSVYAAICCDELNNVDLVRILKNISSNNTAV